MKIKYSEGIYYVTFRHNGTIYNKLELSMEGVKYWMHLVNNLNESKDLETV